MLKSGSPPCPTGPIRTRWRAKRPTYFPSCLSFYRRHYHAAESDFPCPFYVIVCLESGDMCAPVLGQEYCLACEGFGRRRRWLGPMSARLKPVGLSKRQAATMLGIGPVKRGHTPRTGASSILADFCECYQDTRGFACLTCAHMLVFWRLRRALLGALRHEAYPVHREAFPEPCAHLAKASRRSPDQPLCHVGPSHWQRAFGL